MQYISIINLFLAGIHLFYYFIIILFYIIIIINHEILSSYVKIYYYYLRNLWSVNQRNVEIIK